MPIVSNSEAREKLQTVSAKAAFDRMTALGAHWVVIEERPGHVYISPSIETKKIGGHALHSLSGGWARKFDTAVVREEKALISAASKKDTLVIVNAGGGRRCAEFTYDKKTKTFVPFV